MIPTMRSSANRTQGQSSSDYEKRFSEEGEVESTPRAKRRTKQEHVIGRTSKRTRITTPSSEDPDYDTGAEASSGEGTGGSDDNFPKRSRRQHNRGHQRYSCNSKGSSEDQKAVSRPRTQMAGNNPQVCGTLPLYDSLHTL